MKLTIKQFFASAAFSVTALFANAQTADHIFKAAGSPANPKVAVSWNRYYDHAGITDILKKIAAAHP
ncbi:MAG: hypothetical protein KA160_09310, partial [Lacibacter sp.]|nr:hypothetical protein [Lacibacter sp.]